MIILNYYYTKFDSILNRKCFITKVSTMYDNDNKCIY